MRIDLDRRRSKKRSWPRAILSGLPRAARCSGEMGACDFKLLSAAPLLEGARLPPRRPIGMHNAKKAGLTESRRPRRIDNPLPARFV